MRLDDLAVNGARTLTVCNACRYCEQYCPVFPAMEERTAFGRADLSYLANLCHNCGECLYACQYAPPHEFAIDVPRTLAQIRLASYEAYAWPRPLSSAFRRHSVGSAAVLTAVFSTALLAGAGPSVPTGDFYAVVPHGAMVALFGSVFVFAVLAIAIGVRRFVRDVHAARPLAASATPAAAAWRAIRDGITLRHLHANGADCVSGEEERQPWRRWWHHCVLFGFLLCFASTSVAAAYHALFGWVAPYDYTSIPVLLGSAGGGALLAGCAGLWSVRSQRDPSLGDPLQEGPDRAFIALLFVTSLTGLVLLVLRESSAMRLLLAVHLGAVMALFVTLPYGKFVHGFYRVAALWEYERDRSRH